MCLLDAHEIVVYICDVICFEELKLDYLENNTSCQDWSYNADLFGVVFVYAYMKFSHIASYIL